MHENEEFLLTLTPDELESLVQDACNLSNDHMAALSEQLRRVGVVTV